MASSLDHEHIERLEQLGVAVKSFDKARSLKRSRTFDHSAPDIDNADLKLALSIKHFDKSTQLKRSETLDHSSPVLNSPEVKLGLSIRHFDKERSLRRTKTLDKSSAMLEPLKLPLAIQHFETGTLKHVEPIDKSSPLHIYELTRSLSCYQDYSDTSALEENEVEGESDVHEEQEHENTDIEGSDCRERAMVGLNNDDRGQEIKKVLHESGLLNCDINVEGDMKTVFVCTNGSVLETSVDSTHCDKTGGKETCGLAVDQVTNEDQRTSEDSIGSGRDNSVEPRAKISAIENELKKSADTDD